MNEIYKITNKINGKIYVGLTIQGTGVRYLHHLYEARSGSTFPIHRAIRKYGESNFEVTTIVSIETQEELKNLEKFYIKELKANNRQFGYNMTEGGDGTFGRLHSEETKEKIRQKAIGRIIKEETKERLKERQALHKINDPLYYEKKWKAVEASNKVNRKSIEVYSIDNIYLKTYQSVTEAALDLGVTRSGISKSLNPKYFKSNKNRKYIYKYTI